MPSCRILDEKKHHSAENALFFPQTKFSYWKNTDLPTEESLDTSSGTFWIARSDARLMEFKIKSLN